MSAVCGGMQVAAQALGELLPAAMAAQPSTWPPFAAVLLLEGDDALRQVRRRFPQPPRPLFARGAACRGVALGRDSTGEGGRGGKGCSP